MNRLVIAVVLVGGLLAHAQSPEDEWSAPKVTPPPQPGPALDAPPLPPPPPPLLTPPPPVFSAPPSSGPLRPRAEVLARARPAEPRNETSMMGANSLGWGNRAQMVSLGFPLLSIRALFGLGEAFDLGVGFDSYYFLMNEPLAVARLQIVKGGGWAFGATLEAGYAFFSQRASREVRSSRWLTGRRNINVIPSLVVSYQGDKPRAARLFFDLRYLLALDTEPYATDPLTGVPPAVLPGHNVILRGGVELPLSAKTSAMLGFGFDVHGRADDSVVMPHFSVGLITGL